MRISREERRRLMELAKFPVSAHRGTPYPCDQKDLESYLRLPHPNNKQMLDRMEATYQLTRFNRLTKELSPNEKAARRNLKMGLLIENWGPDLAIKAFRDLDALFFMGRLHGNCLLEWQDKAAFREDGENACFGLTIPRSYGQAKIILSSYDIMLKAAEPYMGMFRTLLHESWW